MMVSNAEGTDYKQLNSYKTTVIRELNLAKGCRFNLRVRFFLHFHMFKGKINKQKKKLRKYNKNRKYIVLQIMSYNSSLHTQFLVGK